MKTLLSVQTGLTSNQHRQVVEQTLEVNGKQAYHSPEVVDLGKASELLQGGGVHGLDSFYQTQW